MGIRMALGARQRDVLALVVKQGLKLVMTGLATGLACALILTRLPATLLYGVSSTDPLTFVSLTVLLAAIGLLACYVPARRATRIDPMMAVRYE
jgi:ABC-type antimicrobial peptide transport system permease subunit